MQDIERYLLIGLGVLVVLTVGAIFLAPYLQQDEAPEKAELAIGESETMRGQVVEVLEEGTVEGAQGESYPYQRLLIRITSGSMEGEEIELEEGTVNVVNKQRFFDAGDRVYVERVGGQEADRFYISDPIRIGPLVWIGVLFAGFVVLVGRGRGARSLLGTLFSLIVVFLYIIPQIVAGRDPVFVSVSGSVVLLAVSTYLVYGWNPKAHAAVGGMMVSLLLTGLLAGVFVRWSRLTGINVEESAFLVMELGPDLNFQGLILGGIIIGSLGVLDDVCVAQSSAVFELANTNRRLSWKELFQSSLNIGRDHIAAMVNTLLLAYAGASLPLLLVFSLYSEPIWRRINREPIAEEIVRTMVGSIGLILAVPITGLVASLVARWAIERARRKDRAQREVQHDVE